MRTESTFAQSIREKRQLLINLLDREPDRKKVVKAALECVRSVFPLFKYTATFSGITERKGLQRDVDVVESWLKASHDEYVLNHLKFNRELVPWHGTGMIGWHANCAVLELFASIAPINTSMAYLRHPGDITEYDTVYGWACDRVRGECDRKFSAPFWAIHHAIQAHICHRIESASWLEHKFLWRRLEENATMESTNKITVIVCKTLNTT